MWWVMTSSNGNEKLNQDMRSYHNYHIDELQNLSGSPNYVTHMLGFHSLLMVVVRERKTNNISHHVMRINSSVTILPMCWLSFDESLIMSTILMKFRTL